MCIFLAQEIAGANTSETGKGTENATDSKDTAKDTAAAETTKKIEVLSHNVTRCNSVTIFVFSNLFISRLLLFCLYHAFF